MLRILIVSTLTTTHRFSQKLIEKLKENGNEINYLAYGNDLIPNCSIHYKIKMSRKPFSICNILAYYKIKKIIRENKYDIIHCHTPVASFLTRIAARKSHSKVIYTAHGFHFYIGAPIINWIIFFPVEYLLARFTDCIITINKEDYEIANKYFSKYTKVKRINGVGVDIKKFTNEKKLKEKLRRLYDIKNDAFVITYVAEINKNKNQLFLLKSVEKIMNAIPTLLILLIGPVNTDKVQHYIKKHKLEKNVKLLGYRTDIKQLNICSDLCFSSSIREGLPINIIEAMASELPIVCSINRGHTNLIIHDRNGLLFSLKNRCDMENCIISVYRDKEKAYRLAKEAYVSSKNYSDKIAVDDIISFYKETTSGIIYD